MYVCVVYVREVVVGCVCVVLGGVCVHREGNRMRTRVGPVM